MVWYAMREEFQAIGRGISVCCIYCTDCHAPELPEGFLVVVYVMLYSHWLAQFWISVVGSIDLYL
jgi:hypothetical protein